MTRIQMNVYDDDNLLTGFAGPFSSTFPVWPLEFFAMSLLLFFASVSFVSTSSPSHTTSVTTKSTNRNKRSKYQLYSRKKCWKDKFWKLTVMQAIFFTYISRFCAIKYNSKNNPHKQGSGRIVMYSFSNIWIEID